MPRGQPKPPGFPQLLYSSPQACLPPLLKKVPPNLPSDPTHGRTEAKFDFHKNPPVPHPIWSSICLRTAAIWGGWRERIHISKKMLQQALHQGCGPGGTRDAQLPGGGQGHSYQTRWHRDARLWLQISARCHREDTPSCLGRARGEQELSDCGGTQGGSDPGAEISPGTRLKEVTGKVFWNF